ncbi:P-loop containing NTP hydrolase pore-1 protein, partial [Helicosporidium sp. ATCC 50920]
MLAPPRSWEMPARAQSRPPSETRGNDGVPVGPAPPSRPPRNHGEEDEGVVESAIEQVFSAYRCLSLGVECRAHPGQVAESASLASISPPPLTYPLDAFPPDLISRGTLSGLQLEGAASACAQHLRWLPCGARAGFFLGDGAGVGKGRQVAAVIADNFVRGRTRALWVSSSGDLSADAARDLKDLGCFIPMHVGSKALGKAPNGPAASAPNGPAASAPSGVLFLTYATLSSQGGGAGQRRLDQVVAWLGGPSFEGALVLDECHRAKNCVPGRPGAGTRVAQAVLELQAALPRARVLYCSATGVSEIGDLAYMSRLGLWGFGSSFRDFGAFLDSVRRRGVSFMELLAMELKKEGLYLSRGLSFQDASFALLDCPLSASQTRCYEAAAALWKQARDALVEAVVATGGGADAWK